MCNIYIIILDGFDTTEKSFLESNYGKIHKSIFIDSENIIDRYKKENRRMYIFPNWAWVYINEFIYLWKQYDWEKTD